MTEAMEKKKPALAKCTTNEEAQEKNTAGGRGIKRCRSSSLDDHRHQNQVCEKSLCLVLTDYPGYGCDNVYSVNLDDDDNDYTERNFVEITPSWSKSKPYGEMFASLGSCLYVLGGPTTKPKPAVERKPGEKVNLFSRNVFYFDTNNQEEGWKRGPDMLVARDYSGKAVSLDGKIYVLGGLEGIRDGLRSVVASPPEPWGEVFDLVKNEWEPLTPLPDYINRNSHNNGPVFTYGLEGNKKIVIGGRGYGRFAYHVKSGNWEDFDPEISYPEGVKPVGAGNVMYWTDDGKLWGLRVKNGSEYRGRIKGSGLRVQGPECLHCFHPKDPEPELFHLGGRKFCFFTVRALRGGRTRVRCSKFEVSKRIRPPPPATHNYGSLIAAVVSRVTYILDRPTKSFDVLGLLVDGMPGGVRGRKCSKATDKVEEMELDT